MWGNLTEENKKVIENEINDGHNVLLCITDCEPTENYPLNADEVEAELKKVFWKHLSDEKIKIIVIPEIE